MEGVSGRDVVDPGLPRARFNWSGPPSSTSAVTITKTIRLTLFCLVYSRAGPDKTQWAKCSVNKTFISSSLRQAIWLLLFIYFIFFSSVRVSTFPHASSLLYDRALFAPQGEDCTTVCPPGLYGPGCTSTCSCHNHATCSAVDGSCVCREGNSTTEFLLVNDNSNAQQSVVSMSCQMLCFQR